MTSKYELEKTIWTEISHPVVPTIFKFFLEPALGMGSLCSKNFSTFAWLSYYIASQWLDGSNPVNVSRFFEIDRVNTDYLCYAHQARSDSCGFCFFGRGANLFA